MKKSEVFHAMLTSRLYFVLYSQRNLKCSYFYYNAIYTHKEILSAVIFTTMQCLFQLAMQWNLIFHWKLQVKNTIQKYNDKLQQLLKRQRKNKRNINHFGIQHIYLCLSCFTKLFSCCDNQYRIISKTKNGHRK